MKDDYLWDGSGEPDPEVQKLEEALGRYRQNQPAPKFDEITQTHKAKRPRNFFNWRWEYQLSAVAASLLKKFLGRLDRKSTRLNSSHVKISYAVFCLKKKKKQI